MRATRFHFGCVFMLFSAAFACKPQGPQTGTTGKTSNASGGVDASGLPALASINCASLRQSNCSSMTSTAGNGNAMLGFSISSSPLDAPAECAYLTATRGSINTLSIMILSNNGGFQFTPPFKYLDSAGNPQNGEQRIDQNSVGTSFGSVRYGLSVMHTVDAAAIDLNMPTYAPGAPITLKFSVRSKSSTGTETNLMSGCVSGNLPPSF